MVEIQRHVPGDSGLVRPGIRHIIPGAHVSPVDAVIPCGPCGCCSVYRCLYPCSRIQQLLLVRSSLEQDCSGRKRAFSNARQRRVPIQVAFGRRPVLIFSTLICLISNIWRAVATSYGSYMGACVLNGFGAGPSEVRNAATGESLSQLCDTALTLAQTAQPEIIADIIFLHSRGAYQTLYFTFYFGSLMVRPADSALLSPFATFQKSRYLCCASRLDPSFLGRWRNTLAGAIIPG